MMKISRYNFLTIEWDAKDKEESVRVEEKEAELVKAGYTRIGPAIATIPHSSFMMSQWSRPIYSFTGVGCEKIDRFVV